MRWNEKRLPHSCALPAADAQVVWAPCVMACNFAIRNRRLTTRLPIVTCRTKAQSSHGQRRRMHHQSTQVALNAKHSWSGGYTTKHSCSNGGRPINKGWGEERAGTSSIASTATTPSDPASLQRSCMDRILFIFNPPGTPCWACPGEALVPLVALVAICPSLSQAVLSAGASWFAWSFSRSAL
jgi:hypothetical protein